MRVPKKRRPYGGTRRKRQSRQTDSWAAQIPLELKIFAGIGAFIIMGLVLGLAARHDELPNAIAPNQPPQSAAALGLPDQSQPGVPFNLSGYQLPPFPDLGPGQPIPASQVQLHLVKFSNPSQGMQPAFNMNLRVYMPSGEHAAGSLPLVLVAPAGSPLFIGNHLDDADYHVETLPYAEAGAVVIHYSLDGSVPDLDSASDFQLMHAHTQYRNACSGLVNAKCAIEYALAKIPAVNPQKIITAGHSSAATHAALLAEHESRLAACIAYCPCIDVEKWCQGVVDAVGNSSGFRGIETFLNKSSPRNFVDKIQCPVFLFHPLDDSRVDYSESQMFYQRLTELGKDVTFSKPDVYGDHYQPMVDVGIPRAIEWLRSKDLL